MSIIRRNNNGSTLNQNYFQSEEVHVKSQAALPKDIDDYDLQNHQEGDVSRLFTSNKTKLQTVAKSTAITINGLRGGAGQSASMKGFRTRVQEMNEGTRSDGESRIRVVMNSNSSLTDDKLRKNTKITLQPKVINCNSSSSSDAQSVLNIDEEEHEYGNELDFEVESTKVIREHRKYNSLDVDHQELVNESDHEVLSKT